MLFTLCFHLAMYTLVFYGRCMCSCVLLGLVQWSVIMLTYEVSVFVGGSFVLCKSTSEITVEHSTLLFCHVCC